MFSRCLRFLALAALAVLLFGPSPVRAQHLGDPNPSTPPVDVYGSRGGGMTTGENGSGGFLSPGCDEEVATDLREMGFHAVDRNNHFGNMIITQPPSVFLLSCFSFLAELLHGQAAILYRGIESIIMAIIANLLRDFCAKISDVTKELSMGAKVSGFLMGYGFLCFGTAPGCKFTGGDPTGDLFSTTLLPAAIPGLDWTDSGQDSFDDGELPDNELDLEGIFGGSRR